MFNHENDDKPSSTTRSLIIIINYFMFTRTTSNQVVVYMSSTLDMYSMSPVTILVWFLTTFSMATQGPGSLFSCCFFFSWGDREGVQPSRFPCPELTLVPVCFSLAPFAFSFSLRKTAQLWLFNQLPHVLNQSYN